MKKQKIYYPDFNPVDYYNRFHIKDSIDILESIGEGYTFDTEQRRLFRDEQHVIWKANGFYPSVDQIEDIKDTDKDFTPFYILTKYKFKGNHIAAYNHVLTKIMNKDIPYLRIGTSYFKKVRKQDRFNVVREELVRWTKQEIVDDYNKSFLSSIARYDGFTLKPSNVNYQATVDDHYNMYAPFSHSPKKGDWKWTKRLLIHIFGEQYELGIKYMQALYLHPEQALPVLVLSSRERMTGKSTFVNWISQLFGANSTVLSATEIENSFNGSYSTSNIISIEETVSERRSLVEKIKDLATKKMINVNKKYLDQYDIPFFGKLILTTNFGERFMIVDDDEVRFWIRELSKPEFHNANIEDDLVTEIPAFIHYLETLPDLDRSKSRMVFTPEEIRTVQLDVVKANSRSWLYKELTENFELFFLDNMGLDYVLVHPEDIKQRFFEHNRKVEINYIRRVLRSEFNLETEQPCRYNSWCEYDSSHNNNLGRPFRIDREVFFTQLQDEVFKSVTSNK